MNWSGNFREGLAREIRENKTLAKITAYTVHVCLYVLVNVCEGNAGINNNFLSSIVVDRMVFSHNLTDRRISSSSWQNTRFIACIITAWIGLDLYSYTCEWFFICGCWQSDPPPQKKKKKKSLLPSGGAAEMPTVPFLQYLVLFSSCKYLWFWAKFLKILFFSEGSICVHFYGNKMKNTVFQAKIPFFILKNTFFFRKRLASLVLLISWQAKKKWSLYQNHCLFSTFNHLIILWFSNTIWFPSHFVFSHIFAYVNLYSLKSFEITNHWQHNSSFFPLIFMPLVYSMR